MLAIKHAGNIWNQYRNAFEYSSNDVERWHEMDVERPTLSIITVTWNSQNDIINCLDTLFSTVKNLTYEIIIVDNGSTDSTVELIRSNFPQVALITNNENHGYASANNRGISLAKSPYIFLLNPDTLIQECALELLIEYIDKNPHVGMIGPRLLNGDGSIQKSCLRVTSLNSVIIGCLRGGKYVPADMTHSSPVEGLSGAALMVRRELIHDIGLLDEEFFMYGEDNDWCYRARRAGWEVHYFPHAKIIHHGGQSAGQIPAITYVRHRAALLLMTEKHRPGYHKWLLKYMFFFNILLRFLSNRGEKRRYYRNVLDLYLQIMNKHGKDLYPLQRPHRPR